MRYAKALLAYAKAQKVEDRVYEEECGSESAGNEVPSLCAKGTAYIGRRR